MPAPLPLAVRLEVAPKSVALILATVAGAWLAWQLRTVVLILVMALILAGTFSPVVSWMARRSLRRIHALILLYVALSVVTVVLLVLTIPPLVSQLTELVQHAPAERGRLIALLSERRLTLPIAHAVEGTELGQAFAKVVSYLLGYSSQAVQVVGYGATVLVLSFYLLADPERTQGVAYALAPRGYHLRLARILASLETIVGGYVRGQIITSAAIGGFVFLLLAVFRVPNALSLALFAALVDVIPFIGGLLVIVPAVLSALSRGLPVAALVCATLLVYMEFESRVLVPRVYGKVLRLSSATVILALVAGGTLMGVMGALLALPIAAALLMILRELRVEMPGDDSVDNVERADRARSEAVYDQLSAGATAEEAGQNARDLASGVSGTNVRPTTDRVSGDARSLTIRT